MAGTIELIAQARALHAPTAEDVIFVPVKSQRELKAIYWEKWEENPIVDADKVNAAMIAHEIGDKRIHRWWVMPLFKEWFLNKNLITQKIIANAEKAHELVQQLLDDEKLTPSQKLMAVKMAQDSYDKLMAKRIARAPTGGLKNKTREELEQIISNIET